MGEGGTRSSWSAEPPQCGDESVRIVFFQTKKESKHYLCIKVCRMSRPYKDSIWMEIPVRTLKNILNEAGVQHIDLFSLDIVCSARNGLECYSFSMVYRDDWCIESVRLRQSFTCRNKKYLRIEHNAQTSQVCDVLSDFVRLVRGRQFANSQQRILILSSCVVPRFRRKPDTQICRSGSRPISVLRFGSQENGETIRRGCSERTAEGTPPNVFLGYILSKHLVWEKDA